jgi:threonine dehydrogenase-like Zn-dependent dehydrogenase
MRILQIGKYPEIDMLDVEIPEPGPGEARLHIQGVTTCPQWDLHARHDEPMFVGHKFVFPYMIGQPGHEATGVVDAIGTGVTELKVGDRASIWRDPGHDRPGCYAEYVVRPVDHIIRVPERLPVEATASVELAMCIGATFIMLKAMNLLEGRRAGVTGLGPAGLVAMQMARAEGAVEVVGFDPVEERRALAEASGFGEAFDPRGDLQGRFPARPAWPALDYVIDCVGSRASVEFSMDHACETAALFGVQREDYIYGIRHYGGLRLCGYPGHSREAAEYAVGLMDAGKLDLAPLVTHRLPLSRYQEGIDLLESQQAVKVCFDPRE